MPTTTPSFPTFSCHRQICLWVEWSLTIEPLAWAPPVVRRTRERESDRNEKQRDGDRDREGERQREPWEGHTHMHTCITHVYLHAGTQPCNAYKTPIYIHTVHKYTQCIPMHTYTCSTQFTPAHITQMHVHASHTTSMPMHTPMCTCTHSYSYTCTDEYNTHMHTLTHKRNTVHTHALIFLALCSHTPPSN